MSQDSEAKRQPGTSSRIEAIRRNSDTEDERRALKKAKFLQREQIYIDNLPSCEAYERSYMHRDVISHLQMTKTQFLITVSVDGYIKFWKKTATGIEFVKSFKSHVGPIEDISITSSGSELASIARVDRSAKIFDVVNFDMINMFSLEFEPGCVEWINTSAIGAENLLISDSNSPRIYVFDARQSSSQPKRVLDQFHSATVCRMRYNPEFNVVISADKNGILEYWTCNEDQYESPRSPLVSFKSVADTDLSEFVSKDQDSKIMLHDLTFSSNGQYFATTSSDRKIRVFKFSTGKLLRIFDESLEKLEAMHKEEPIMTNIDFARKIAIERELVKTNMIRCEKVIFDNSGNFIVFPTMTGAKICNWRTQRLIRSFGREETNFRPLCLSLFQGLIFEKMIRKVNIDSLETGISDPTLYSTSYKRNRFYCFSNRYFEETTSDEMGGGKTVIKDRDIFNEKPSREEALSATDITDRGQIEPPSRKQVYESAIIHTTLGDIHLRLYPDKAPKACENFCAHAKGNYYNNHIFHRVIKQFMIQTGDPTGTGAGGESIWEDEFEDEFNEDLKHDKPFTVSMANCGPNTNGSQFFITVSPCPFLDGKHTIFGKVTRGMDVCLNISKVKTNPKTDKPYEDIKIVNIKPY